MRVGKREVGPPSRAWTGQDSRPAARTFQWELLAIAIIVIVIIVIVIIVIVVIILVVVIILYYHLQSTFRS